MQGNCAKWITLIYCKLAAAPGALPVKIADLCHTQIAVEQAIRVSKVDNVALHLLKHPVTTDVDYRHACISSCAQKLCTYMCPGGCVSKRTMRYDLWYYR